MRDILNIYFLLMGYRYILYSFNLFNFPIFLHFYKLIFFFDSFWDLPYLVYVLHLPEDNVDSAVIGHSVVNGGIHVF